MECSDTTALSSYVLVNDTLLVNESSPTEENGALYQSSAGNTKTKGKKDLLLTKPVNPSLSRASTMKSGSSFFVDLLG
jgi:hypothetical protein